MSTIGDALKALRAVILLHKEVGDLRSATEALGEDLKALGHGLADTRDRVARLEGFLEGATAASRATPRLPRTSG